MSNRLPWDEYWLNMVYFIASRSTDDSTHIGAVVVDDDHVLRSIGYNGFCRGVNHDDPKKQLRPAKYLHMEHAERNAIYSAARTGMVLKGCTIFSNGIPCCDCARAIVQAGIKRVVVDLNWDKAQTEVYANKWAEQFIQTKALFDECGIELVEVDVTRPLQIISTLQSGECLKIDENTTLPEGSLILSSPIPD